MTADLASLMPQRVAAPDLDIAAAWSALEERYLEGRYAGAGATDEVDALLGPVPVLFTAGHAVTHRRNGAVKVADMATGGLADVLRHRAGTASLTVTGLPRTDPNFDRHGSFKDALTRVLPHVAAVIDLHGMKDSHGVDVCLGRGARPHLAEPLVARLRDALTRHGFTVSVDAPFDAARDTTITSTVQHAGVPAVQVELARRLRNPWDHQRLSATLVTALSRAAVDIAAA